MADDNLDPGTTDSGGGETSLHDDIAAAFEQHESADPAPTAPAAAPKNQQAAPAQPPPARDAPGPAPDGRVRDPATGRFAEGKAPAAPAVKPAAPLPTAPLPGGKPTQAVKPAAPLPPTDAPAPTRAPASWKPTAREHWAKLPPDVQQEVVRRETETARVLQESSKAREALTHVQGALSPFAQNIAASGHDAVTFIETLAKADNTLRHGSVAAKASFMANLIQSYGVDITSLDQALAGQQVTPDPNAALADRMRQEMQAQLQPVLGFFNQIQGQRQNALAKINTQSASDVEAFSQDGAHEFFEDVREDMADIIDMFSKRGQQITLQEAYDRAINVNPQISAITAQRAEATRASNAAAAAQRARRTAASITSAPAPAGVAPGPAGDDRRATIAAAFDDQASS